MDLFHAAIRRDSASLLRFLFLSHIQFFVILLLSIWFINQSPQTAVDYWISTKKIQLKENSTENSTGKNLKEDLKFNELWNFSIKPLQKEIISNLLFSAVIILTVEVSIYIFDQWGWLMSFYLDDFPGLYKRPHKHSLTLFLSHSRPTSTWRERIQFLDHCFL